MLRILLFLLFFLAAGLLLWVYYCGIRGLSYRREDRFCQFRLGLATLVTVLVLFSRRFFPVMLETANGLVNHPVLRLVWDVLLPGRAFELLYMLLLTVALNLILALTVLSVLSAVKLVFHLLTFRKKDKFVRLDRYSWPAKALHLPWLLVYPFYVPSDYGYRLTERGHTLGVWMRWIKRVFLVLWAAELAAVFVSVLAGPASWNDFMLAVTKSWNLIPMAGVLLAAQLEWFWQGDRGTDVASYYSADIGQTLTGDLEPLIRYYRSLFGPSGALLADVKNEGGALAREGLRSNDLSRFQVETCRQPEALTVLSRQLLGCGVQKNTCWQNALIALLNGESVEVKEFPQGEFMFYLAAYLNYYLAQGKTALVLCPDPDAVPELCAILQDRMARLNGLGCVWQIAPFSAVDENNDPGILVGACGEFALLQMSERQPAFAENLFCTVLLDAGTLFTWDGIRLERMFSALRTAPGMKQFAVFSSQDNPSLRTAAEYYCGTELVPFKDDRFPDRCHFMLWRAERSIRMQRMLGLDDGQMPGIGPAYPLALAAVRYDIPQVYLLENEEQGDRTYRESLSKNRRGVMAFLGRETDLDHILCSGEKLIAGRQPLAVAVLYDQAFNPFGALMRWLKYGGESGNLLHIISPPYLLREYFADRFLPLLGQGQAYDALYGARPVSDRARASMLLAALNEEKLSTRSLLRLAERYGWEERDVESVLTHILATMRSEAELHNIYEYFHFEERRRFSPEADGFREQVFVSLRDEAASSALRRSLRPARLTVNGAERGALPVLAENLENYWLPDQILAWKGQLFQVTDVLDGELAGEECMPAAIPWYAPVSAFRIENRTLVDGCIDTDALDFNLCSADVTRTVYGYWQSFNGNDLWDRASLQLNDLRTKRGFRREISRQGVQILEIRLPGDLLGSDTARAVRLAAVMIGEVSKTLFPQTWQNLFVAVPKDGPEPEELIHRDASFEDRVRSILPYAEGMPEEPGFASLYLIEFSCVELGMVHTLYQNRRRLFSILRDYLEWYLAGTAETEPAQAEETPEDGAAGPLPEDAGSPPAPYLYYGGEEEPELFSSRALLELCRRFLPEEQSAAAPQAEPIGEEAMTDCTFCGRPTLYPVRMDDGRCMCSRCAQQQVSREEEVWDLFGETEAFMEKTYRIRFRKRIQVQFQSLDAIHRFAGEQTNGRYIGFYSPKLRQLWIERNGPRIAVQDTLIHELTHLWQYDNLEISRAQARLPVPPWQKAKKMLTILEGHAVYVEVETMRRLNEEGYAADLHDRYMAREDEYGEGYRTMRRYFEEKARLGSHMTPFASMQQLFDDIIHRRGREAGIL